MSDHGTTSAMWRHRKRKEVLCDECRPLWNAYMAEHKARVKARTIDTSNVHCRAMDEALEKRPPVIQWRKNNHGVMVATSVNDPHAESVGHAELLDRIDRRAAEEARSLLEMQEQARMVAQRFEKHRADNTPLMNAARRGI